MRAVRIAGVVLATVVLFGGPFVLIEFLEGHPTFVEGSRGYLTVVLIGLVTNATLLVPTPTLLPVVVAVADQNNIVWLACVYAGASAVGESTAYLVGRIANQVPFIQHSRTHKFLERHMQGRWKTGGILLMLAATPSPYDVGGVIAGNTRYPFVGFWAATFLGRWGKYLYMIPMWGIIEDRILEEIPWIGPSANGIMMALLLLAMILIERRAFQHNMRKLSKGLQAG